MGFSRPGLIEQLVFEGYTRERSERLQALRRYTDSWCFRILDRVSTTITVSLQTRDQIRSLGASTGLTADQVVSRADEPANRHGLAVVCPIGSAHHDAPTRVEVEPGRSGLDQVSYVQCEQVRTVSTVRLVHRLGSVDLVAMSVGERVPRLLFRL